MSNLLNDAKKFYEKKKYKKALLIYKQAKDIEPNNLEVMMGILECLYYLSENPNYVQQAKETSKEIIGFAPHAVRPYIVLSYLEKDIIESRLYAEKAMQLDRTHADVLCCYGVLLLREGKSAEAIDYLEEAIKLNPNSYLAHYNLMVGYQNINEVRKKIGQVKTVFRLKPNVINLIQFLNVYFVGNPIFVLVLLLLPFIYIVAPYKFLFLSHGYILGFYLSSAALSIKYKTFSNKKKANIIIGIVGIIIIDILIFLFRNYALS